jgi:FAD dependent oxidoreductase
MKCEPFSFLSVEMVYRFAGAALVCALLCSLLVAPAAAQAQGPVLVVGGTPAGVAAAVAAARHGAEVTLVARRDVLGGILTDAMMDQWDFNSAPDGVTIQGGLFSEIHAALGDAFTPDAAAREFEMLVAAEPRIHLITGAQVIDVTSEAAATGRDVTSVRFRRKDGSRFDLAATTVVDATDDGDVAAMAGARYDVGRQDTGLDERMQPVTLMFTVRGVDWRTIVEDYTLARYGRGGAGPRRAWGYAKLLADYQPLSPAVVVRDLNFGRESDGEVTVNAINVLGIDGRYDTEIARARGISERETPHLLAFLRARLPGFANVMLSRYADAVYVRETRHFAGVERLTADDVWNGKIPDDTIGLSSYPLDLHPVTTTDRPAYAPVRHVYGIPFGTLVPRDLTNVILASPAISATHIAAGSARVIPTTIEEGEAAGVAAALAQHLHLSFITLARAAAAIGLVRQQLERGGSILTYDPTKSAVTMSAPKATARENKGL